jgi:hypothetical protein
VFAIIKKIEDKKKRSIVCLKNVKNELNYYGKLRETNRVLNQEQEKRVNSLYNTKKECIREILILKSAFSIVDQMFVQEIKNAEIKKHHWFIGWFCCNKALNLKDPESINRFISGIMDPFKDKEEYDKKQEEYLKKERKRIAKENSTIVCWPFCYKQTIDGEEEEEKAPVPLPRKSRRGEHNLTPSMKAY